jgi:hypothetical protein
MNRYNIEEKYGISQIKQSPGNNLDSDVWGLSVMATDHEDPYALSRAEPRPVVLLSAVSI